MPCTTCGAEQGSDTNSLLLCSKCKNTRYCSINCQRTDWKAHKKTCRSPANSSISDVGTDTEKVPCVYTSPGSMGMPGGGSQGIAHTESTYPKHLLSGPNLVDSKISELFGTPIQIIKSPINVQHALNIEAGTSKLMMKPDYDHGSILTIETDPNKPRFGRPTSTIKGGVAFVRKDRKFLDWRIVEHMAMYIEIEIQKRLTGELESERGQTKIQSAEAVMNPESYRESFWEAREMLTLPGQHWADPGWGKAIADDPF